MGFRKKKEPAAAVVVDSGQGKGKQTDQHHDASQNDQDTGENLFQFHEQNHSRLFDDYLYQFDKKDDDSCRIWQEYTMWMQK